MHAILNTKEATPFLQSCGRDFESYHLSFDFSLLHSFVFKISYNYFMVDILEPTFLGTILKNELRLKSYLCYIFASLIFKSKREHL